ncbi:hypothetical protein Q0590_07155 [Rhodocytophaga aerolata]|uniref:Uncharacterized protein n=1 Tax=Rhodocytophaga aerolata TaxID=455078 RepID=A0ABT8R475_9BACT|nr:hypothetical protein [Rhodocytophaga aerolata]MDO1446023.1 hypothetical protein [Rhodocytophaga aerolata]
MITYFRFLLLPLSEKNQYLQQNGTFLLDYSGDKGIVKLYAVGDFFVELYSNYSSDCISEVVAFKNIQRLQQHADHIDLALLSA